MAFQRAFGIFLEVENEAVFKDFLEVKEKLFKDVFGVKKKVFKDFWG